MTTAARTIVDLERVASASELRRAMRQAEVDGLPIDGDVAPDGTRSELEFIFVELWRKGGIPRPRVNVQIGPYVVDFVWPAQRLRVETDGYRYHRGRTSFEADRVRDLELHTLGYDVIRLTYRQVVDKPTETASAISRALEVDGAKFGLSPSFAPSAG